MERIHFHALLLHQLFREFVNELFDDEFCQFISLCNCSADALILVRDTHCIVLVARAREWSGDGESLLARARGRGDHHVALCVRTFQNDGGHVGGGTTTRPAGKRE